MRIGILAPPASWYYRDLARAASDDQHLVSVSFSTLASRVGTHATSVRDRHIDFSSVDGVLVRSMPPGSLEQVVFRMDALHRAEASGTLILNRPRTLETAIDKYLALTRLQEAGLQVPETIVCQHMDDALPAYQALGGDVVIKPLFGGEGRGLMRVTDAELARRAFQTLTQLNAVCYLQRFIAHRGRDIRLLVIGQQVLGMCRANKDDWRTNVSCGATTSVIDVTANMAAVALRATAAIGADLAAVDLLPGQDGQLYALEINAVPGWRALARTLNVDVARLVWELFRNKLGSCSLPAS